MEWEDFLATLTAEDRPLAARLAVEYGLEAASRGVRYHPLNSSVELQRWLEKDRGRVRTRVPGLYESIDVKQCPPNWTIDRPVFTDYAGTKIVHNDIIGPNGAEGFFERAYNAGEKRIELREAFLRFHGMVDELPSWVADVKVPMVPGRGTPTVQYFTLYQLKLLGVPAGESRWWRRLLQKLGLRKGPFKKPGLVTSIKMSMIENLETILHLHWLRQRYPALQLGELLVHTASVEYAKTTAIQCGYRLGETKYMAGRGGENQIKDLLEFVERGNVTRKEDNNKLLSRFSFDRNTVMLQGFDIKLFIAPE